MMVSNSKTDLRVDPARRRALVVLGMHRSGTSAMTRTLSLLGASLPEHLMAPEENNNVAGFWEPLKVAELNEEILNTVDSDWDDVFSFKPKQYLSNVDHFYMGRAVELLEHEYNGSQFIVIKDPRISVITTFWDRALKEAGYTPHYVIMVRNPLEVAESLRSRDSFPREKSLLLWSSYMIAAERDTRDSQRIFVSYNQLMTDWRSTRDRIEKSIGVPFPRNTMTAANEIDRQLDTRLRHHQLSADDLYSRSDVMDEVKSLYRIFSGACDDDVVDRSSVDAIQAVLAKLDSAVGPMLADHRAKGRRHVKEMAELNNQNMEACNRANLLGDELAAERRAREIDADAATQVAGDRDREIADLSMRVAAAEVERDQLGAQSEATERRNAELADKILAMEAERNHLLVDLRDKEQDAADLSFRIAALQVELDRLEAQTAADLGRAAQNKEDLDASTLEIERTRAELEGARAELAAERDRRLQEVAKMERLNHESDERLVKLKHKLNAVETSKEAVDRRLSERFSEIAKLSTMLIDREQRLSDQTEKAQLRRELYRVISRRPRWWFILSSSKQSKLQQEKLRRLGLFDGQMYLKLNPDVEAAGIDPLDHYICYGIDEDRQSKREV